MSIEKIAKMKSNKNVLPALLEMANGPALFEEIQRRCALADKPVRLLCADSQVSLATLWRMKKAKYVANLKTLVKIEAVLKSWGV